MAALGAGSVPNSLDRTTLWFNKIPVCAQQAAAAARASDSGFAIHLGLIAVLLPEWLARSRLPLESAAAPDLR